MFFGTLSYLPLLAFLSTRTLVSADPVDLTTRNDGNLVKLSIGIPSQTKVIGSDKEFVGPVAYSQSFEFLDAETEDDIKGGKWLTKDFEWWVNQPSPSVTVGDLGQESVKYKMNCTAQAAKPVGKTYSFKINAEKPYVHPTDGMKWEDIVQHANVICPAGECVDKDGCEDLPMPKWDLNFLQNWDDKANT
ncbi:uncharacterized protein I303_105888 [Kwoniella dejecticola CBS 10117]|uniref:Phosphatidylglycerol/phosphatidylinositol transfer protein n=1 Tax=Kwoniella dejecticola CBS 10117 TaxID=1296121 RepID=A0A1A6A0N9_9TREE|nr:uncharacterized protein I303_05910 [Kwoniella dejecticola CBS 10117]OBR83630.1 hypothetical protein I303_05910 [Kwoniella dejecticola CBS 10117]